MTTDLKKYAHVNLEIIAIFANKIKKIIKMNKVAIVLGNGFDLNLLLRTSYTDFAKSKEFEDLSKKCLFSNYIDISNPRKSLFAHLQSGFNTNNWFDIEEEIYSFAINYNNPIPLLSEEFDSIRCALQQYLIRVINNTIPCQESLAYHFMKDIVNDSSCGIRIYSFNYTNCLSLCNCNPNKQVDLYNIHGDLDSNIVIGYFDYKNKITNDECSFMDKANMLKSGGFRMEFGLVEAKEVIFFGHSLNPMDFSYFKSYFNYLENSKSVDQSLTFVCLDNNSIVGIKNNIKSQGYDIRKLYDHLQNINFIRTHNWNERNQEDVKLYNQLSLRLKTL